jgi:hypothetical protein
MPGKLMARTFVTDPGRPVDIPSLRGERSARRKARLATLKRLRATGTISEDEYQARRNKILDEV